MSASGPLVYCCSHSVWGIVFVHCFYIEMSVISGLQSSRRGRESWLLCFGLFMFLLPCGCQCSASLPRGTVGWSVFPSI